jgi:hypothetical protein
MVHLDIWGSEEDPKKKVDQIGLPWRLRDNFAPTNLAYETQIQLINISIVSATI